MKYFAPTLVFAAVAFFYAIFWMRGEAVEAELHRILVVAATVGGGVAAHFFWSHPWVRSRDQVFSARGAFRGLVTGLATVLLTWIIFSVTMFFLTRMQVGLGRILYQYGEKIVWSIGRGPTLIVIAAVYAVVGCLLVARPIRRP